MKERTSVRTFRMMLALFATVFFLFPFVIVLMNAFKTTGEFTSNPFSLPTSYELTNFDRAISQMHFFSALKNSLLLTISICGLISILGATAAYVVSRVRSKFVSGFYYLMIASMCAPFQAYMIPLVKIYASKLGLNNSFIPVIYIGVGLNIAFAMFLIRGFLNSIPFEIDQAAMIDGCSPARTFFSIILPMLKPIQVTMLVFVAMGIWNDYLLSSLFLNTQNMRTLPMMIRVFCAEYSTDYASMMAGLTLCILPMLLFYLVSQKQILSGVVQGSIKG